MDIIEYLSIIINKLETQQYKIRDNIKYENITFKYVAKRISFEAERLAFFTTLFLFSRFENPDFQTLRDFSKKSFKYTTKSFRIYLPPLVFWGLKCFPVAIVDSLDKESEHKIRFEEPPRHFGAFEKLVVFDLKTQVLSYYTLPSIWNDLADTLDRKLILEALSL
jgi:hypothetical protein